MTGITARRAGRRSRRRVASQYFRSRRFAEEAVVRRAVIVLTVLLALLGAAGCNGSSGSRSNRTQCVNGVCQVSLSGEQTIEMEIGSFERDLRVGPIEPNAVTLSVRGD